MAENKPGDGKSSPFGNGGGATSGGTVKASDFVTDPEGAGDTSTTGGVDFVRKPDGSGPSAGKPADFLTQPQGTASAASPKGPGGGADPGGASYIHSDSVPDGGKDLKADPPAVERKKFLGTIAGNAVHKPFKLRGA